MNFLRMLHGDPMYPWVVKWIPRAAAGGLAMQVVLVMILDIGGLEEHSKRIGGISELRWVIACCALLVLMGIVDGLLKAARLSRIAHEVKERTGLDAVVTLTRGGEAVVQTKDTSVISDKFKAPTVAVEVVPPQPPKSNGQCQAPAPSPQTFTPPGE